MKKCNHLNIIPQEIGSPLYKCTINNDKNSSLYGLIKERLNSDSVLLNGECPFAYRNIDLSECPCFKQ